MPQNTDGRLAETIPEVIREVLRAARARRDPGLTLEERARVRCPETRNHQTLARILFGITTAILDNFLLVALAMALVLASLML
jgi:hypothetical protein